MTLASLAPEWQGSPLRYEPCSVSGIRPIGELHLGHYFAVQQIVDQQNRHPGETYCLVADLHATTSWNGGADIGVDTLATAAALLSLGINPHKNFLFLQSSVPRLLEMTYFLACLTTTSLLSRNPVLTRQNLRNTNMGTVLYPVLMAADVLSLRATKIIAGGDQTINARLIRHIARAANHRLGDIFPIPQLLPTRTIPGTDGAKMDHLRDNHIPIFTGFHTLSQRVQQIQTDSLGIRDPKDPEKCIVFRLFSMVAPTAQVTEMRDRYSSGAISYEDAKRQLTIAIMEHFAQSMESFEKWKKRPDDLRDLLRQGGRVASERVGEMIATVREKLRFNS